MPTPFFPTAYQVEVRGLLFGQKIESVFHCIGPDPFNSADAELIASEFQTDWAGLQAVLSTDYAINEIFVHNLAGAASGEFTLAITPAQTGSVDSPSLPGNVAFCVSLRTAESGRTTRGRKYLSGIPKNSYVGNEILADVADALVNGLQSLRNGLSTLGFPMAIFSPTANTLTTVTSATRVDLFLDSQRRRLTGRGS
jgi:hypothetical protein